MPLPSRAILPSASSYGANRWVRGRGRAGSGKAGRAPGTRGPFHFGRRCWRAALLVRAGAAFHEGPVSLGFARQQGHGTVLVMHGENDAIVPIRLGERLYGLIRAPKRFVSVAGAGHKDLGDDAVAAAKQFIAGK